MADHNQLMSVFKGNQIEAKYHAEEGTMYSHNAYIEALPEIMEPSDVARRILRLPAWHESQRQWSAIRRLHAVQTIANYIEPLPMHMDLEQRFSRMIRNGYMARNPISAEWVKQIRAGYQGLEWWTDDNQPPIIQSTAAGFAVVGTSGVGKSTAVKSVLGLYPQVIFHSEYNSHPFNRTQLVWLHLECPYNGSIKGLCQNFFNAIDQILGTRYYQKFNRHAAHQLLPSMAHIASFLGLGVLVIDEIQRISQFKSGGAEQVLNFFVELANTIGVPVVLIGTFKALPLLTDQFAQARRSAGQGDMILSNMANDETWNHLIDKMWRYQWTNMPTELSDAIRKTLYEESQGIIDIAAKLYMLAQWSVIGQQNERLSPARFRAVAKESLRLVRPILDALKRRDMKALSEISDVVPIPIDLQEHLRRAEERVQVEGSLNTLRTQSSSNLGANAPEMEIVGWLLSCGIEQKVAVECAYRAVRLHANSTDIGEAMKSAIKMALQREEETPSAEESHASQTANPAASKKAARTSAAHHPQDLKETVAAGRKRGLPAYETLKEYGIIQPIDELIKLK